MTSRLEHLSRRSAGHAVALAMTLCIVTGSVGPAMASGDAPRWSWPLDPPHAIVHAYVAPATPYSAGHRGVDLMADAGAAVFAPADGVVHFSGTVVDRPVISIEHAGGLISSFEPVESPLAAGMTVHRGDRIGVLRPGHCRTACLHFGVRLNEQYLSPMNYLGGIPHSVLLPTRPLRERAAE